MYTKKYTIASNIFCLLIFSLYYLFLDEIYNLGIKSGRKYLYVILRPNVQSVLYIFAKIFFACIEIKTSFT